MQVKTTRVSVLISPLIAFIPRMGHNERKISVIVNYGMASAMRLMNEQSLEQVTDPFHFLINRNERVLIHWANER
jgi:hypothetical protein